MSAQRKWLLERLAQKFPDLGETKTPKPVMQKLQPSQERPTRATAEPETVSISCQGDFLIITERYKVVLEQSV